MRKTVVINVVGLTSSLIGAHTPHLQSFLAQGSLATITPVVPAVTCTAQATYLTGRLPRDHGVVANGWYFRDECEIKFWRQSNRLVQQPKIWDMARELDPTFTCANLFWWYNMYSTADYSVTPRPMYPADGRKLPDLYTQPARLRETLQTELGQFPLFQFWGPNTSIAATRWIAESAKLVEQQFSPTLSLIYLPHLDYCLQKVGPDVTQISADLREVDQVCGDLIDFYTAHNAQIVILSEYGITHVTQPVHLNRVLRQAGLLTVREEENRELLDAGASSAFAVADHQIAHVYVNDRSQLERVQALLAATKGVATVLDGPGKTALGLDHPRSGELVVLAEPDAWFTYYYWLDDRRAPDFARTVDIHRKPGYDPVELFLDPAIQFPRIHVGSRLLRKQLGLRYLMDVIPLDATLVRGSHGLINPSPEAGPLLITRQTHVLDSTAIAATDVCGIILQHLSSQE